MFSMKSSSLVATGRLPGLLVRLLKRQRLTPKRIITDKLRSYAAAKRDVMPTVDHRSHMGLNNRAEFTSASAKTRTVMQGFRSASGLHRLISVFSAIRNHFVPSHKTHSALLHRSAQWRGGRLRPAPRPDFNRKPSGSSQTT